MDILEQIAPHSVLARPGTTAVSDVLDTVSADPTVLAGAIQAILDVPATNALARTNARNADSAILLECASVSRNSVARIVLRLHHPFLSESLVMIPQDSTRPRSATIDVLLIVWRTAKELWTKMEYSAAIDVSRRVRNLATSVAPPQGSLLSLEILK